MDFEMDHAGASGVQRAEAARVKAEELRREAARLDAFVSQVEKGNEGERLTAAQLDILDGAGWRILNDRVKRPGSSANIDHIAIGPSGVFMIDSKNWSSAVRFDTRGLYAAGFGRQRELDQARSAAEKVQWQAAQVVPRLTVVPVLCFTGAVGLPAPTQALGIVALELPTLLPWLTSQPTRLTDPQVRQLASSLSAAFPPRLRTQAAPRVAPRATSVAARKPRAATRPSASRRRPSKALSPIEGIRLAVGALIAIMLVTGGFAGVASWFGHQMASRIVPATSTPTAPAMR